jgi:hypothetical protein
MFDFDLADLYAVDTKALNQAVSRNLARFPERMVSLTVQVPCGDCAGWR